MALRILIVSDHYPPFIGGAHRQTQLLGRELHQRGHEVAVATVWQPGLPAQHNDCGVTVHRLKQVRTFLTSGREHRGQRHQPPFPDPVTVWQLRRLIRQFRPDVIHSYGWFSYSCAAAMVGTRIPLLISARDYAYGCAKRTLIYRQAQLCNGPQLGKCLSCAGQHFGAPKGWIAAAGVAAGRGLLRRKVSGVHSISSYVQEMVRRDFLYLPSDAKGAAFDQPAEVVIPSFREDDSNERYSDDPEVQEYLARLPEQPFMLFVGALRQVKGLTQLLNAYQRLADPPLLVLIGTREVDTPQSFPPGVVVLHNFPHRAVMAAWEQCLFGVVPSLWPEPLGSVVYEAMSRGKAVIGTKPGGHTDMIADGESGFLVPLGDTDALVEAMQKLIDDRELRERFGRVGRERAKSFTAKEVVPRFEQIYQRLINKARGFTREGSSLPLHHQ